MHFFFIFEYHDHDHQHEPHMFGNRYQPVKDIAEASKSGHATNVIMGISVGLESTCLPVLIMCASILGTCLVCWYCFLVLQLTFFLCVFIITTPFLVPC